MNINGLFQFMNTDICDSFFRDVTPENIPSFLEQLMQNPEFIEKTKEYVDDVSVVRQKVEIKLGQLCKKMKMKEKDESVVPVPVKPTKLVDGYELIRVQYAIDDAAYLRENSVEVPDTTESLDESLGTHIGSNIYLQREGHVIKMTTPQFVVYY